MLDHTDAMATVAVKSLDGARPFYEQVLGLTPVGEPQMGVILYTAGAARIVVYESQFAGTNKATALTWGLGPEIDPIVADLRAKGVVFERYDMPGATYQDGVHVMGEARLVWFKDPDGNIIHMNSFGA